MAAVLLASSDRVELNTSPTASGIPAANIPHATIVDAIPVRAGCRSNWRMPATAVRDRRRHLRSGRNDPDNLRTSAFCTTALRFQHSSLVGLSWQASYQRVHTHARYTNGPLGAGFQPAAESLQDFFGDIDTVDLRATWPPRPWINVSAGYEFEHERFDDVQDNNLPAPPRCRPRRASAQQAHAGFAAAQFGAGRSAAAVVALGTGSRVLRVDAGTFRRRRHRQVYAAACALVAPPRALTGDLSAAYLLSRRRHETARRTSATRIARRRCTSGSAADSPPIPCRGRLSSPRSAIRGSSPTATRRSMPASISICLGRSAAGLGDRLLHRRPFADRVRLQRRHPARTPIPFGRLGGYLNGSGGFSRGVELGLEARPRRRCASRRPTPTRGPRPRTTSRFRASSVVPAVFASHRDVRRDASLERSSRHDVRRVLRLGDLRLRSSPPGVRAPIAIRGFTKAGVIGGYRFASVRSHGCRSRLRQARQPVRRRPTTTAAGATWVAR